MPANRRGDDRDDGRVDDTDDHNCGDPDDVLGAQPNMIGPAQQHGEKDCDRADAADRSWFAVDGGQRRASDQQTDQNQTRPNEEPETPTSAAECEVRGARRRTGGNDLAIPSFAMLCLLASPVEAVFDPRPEIHQASGMVAAQLDIPVAEALVLIRARAYAAGQLVKVIANDVIARRLRLADA